jgi:hypothetical protein
MRRNLLTLVLLVLLVVAGCKALDGFFGYDHDTGQVIPNAPISQVEDVADNVGVLIPGAELWVELGLGILGALGAGYIAIRRFQKKRVPIIAASTTKKGSSGKAT